MQTICKKIEREQIRPGACLWPARYGAGMLLLLLMGMGPLVLGATNQLRILTSFMPVYCFTVNVAGDLAQVQNLLPGNVGPHEYQPTRSDYDKLAAAQLLVVNGLKLEEWVQPLLKSRHRRAALTVVEVSVGLESQLIRDVPTLSLEGTGSRSDARHPHLEASADPNPHIWLDPVLAAHAVTNILQALQRADPANAAGYAVNAARYVERLQRLDGDLRRGLEPFHGVPFVAYHDAFVYFVRRYGLRLVGVIESVPEVTPSLRYQGQLKRLIKQQRVKAIFAEPQFPKKIAEQLSADTGVPLGLLDTLETPVSGVLRPTSYEEGMQNNLRVLLELLK